MEKIFREKNVEYGYYEYNKYIIVAQKENKELSLFENSEDGYKLITKEKMIIGENLGDKFLEGDKRTPEGSYDLVQKELD